MPELKMKPTYKIFILDDDEFNDLHKYIPEVSEKDLKEGLGFANPKTREAYIKRTGVKEWDDETILHEAEELLAKNSSDADENNIRWKKGGVARFIVPAVLSLVPGVGPALAAAASVGMGQSAQARHPEELGKPSVLSGLGQAATGYFGGKALAGGVSGGIAGGAQAAPGFLSKAGGIVSGIGKGAIAGGAGINTNILGMTPATPSGVLSATDVLKGLPAASTNQIAAQNVASYGNLMDAVGTPGFVPGLGFPSQIGTNIATQGAGQAGAGVTPPPTPPTFGQKLGTILTKPETILGGGALLASTAMKQPEFPEIPIDIESIRSGLLSGQGVSPLAQQARANLSQIISKKPEELYPVGTDAYYNAALRQTRLAYKRAQEALAARYNLIDPNYQQSGEYQELARRLDVELANVEMDYTTAEEQRRFELARSAQYQAIRDALNVTDADMQELLGFTRLTVEQAAAKYKVAVEDVTELRRALGGFAGQVLAGMFWDKQVRR